MTSTGTHSADVLDAQREELLGLAEGANGVELQLTVPELHHCSATTAIGPEFFFRRLTENGG